MRPRLATTAIAALLALTAAAGVSARQTPAPGTPKPSQHGEVSQRIAATTMTVVYNRPVARGRELFGSLVPYGRVWCPCADDATTIALTTDVKINGADAGRRDVFGVDGAGARRRGR